jgi:hypothetical protein
MTNYTTKNKNNDTMNPSTKTTTLAALAGLALTAGSASAAVIAQYDFTGAAVTSSDSEPNSTAQDFAATGADLGFSVSGNNAFARSQALAGTDEAAAIANVAYMSFTVSTTAGNKLDLTSLTYTSIHNATNAGAPDTNATMNFFVRSSIDSYAATVGSVFSETWDSTTPNRTIDLSGAAFQNLTSPVTFRLYVYESVELDTNQGARWDDVVLNGNVNAIPEPSAIALLGLGGLALLRRRRK